MLQRERANYISAAADKRANQSSLAHSHLLPPSIAFRGDRRSPHSCLFRMSMLTPSTSEGDVEAITRLADNQAPPSQESSQSQQSQEPLTASAQSAQPKKFTSLNVNKRFLEKASPIPSPALPVSLKLSDSNSPRLSSSPSNSTRLTSAKLSSVPKAQPTGWATTKPATSGAAPSASSPALAPTALASTPAVATDPLPADASTVKPGSSPKPANQSLAPAGSAASPRLVGMGRQSPRPASAGIDFGPISGRASPGLKGSLGTMNRAVSPASASRAPWASLKSGLSASDTRPSTMSDFPTAAEAAKAKQAQEEKAAAAAAKEAARQQAALQALDRFRGTSLGSGKHWDEMEDEDGGFLDEVVEFGDGTQYKISATSDDKAAHPDAPPVTKEERFKDVSHDRSWPPRGPQPPTASSKAPPPSAAYKAPGSAESTAAPSRRSEQKADKVIIPTTGASVSLRSPVESREPASYGYGRERRGPPTYGSASRNETPSAPVASQHATQAVRAWGPLAQRQASLNPGSVPPPSNVPKTIAASSPPSVSTPAATSIASAVSPSPASASVAAAPAPTTAASATLSPSANHAPASKPLPPHMASEERPSPFASRPLPPHLTQNVRPVDEASTAPVGRKTVFSDAEGRHAAPSQPAERTPWGPKGLAQARLGTEAPQATPAPAPPQPTPAQVTEEEDIHSAIERARKRRQEEENVRLAEKERARQKALAIEEKIKAAEAARLEEVRKAAEAKAQAEAEQKKAAEAASSPTAPHLLRKPSGPADNATTWRTTRSPSTSVPTTTSAAVKERAEPRNTRQDRNVSDKAAATSPYQRQQAIVSPGKEAEGRTSEQDPIGATWRREQAKAVEPSAPAQAAQTKAQAATSPQDQAPTSSTPSDAPRIILSRPTQPSQSAAVHASTDKSAARRQPASTPEKVRRESTGHSDRKAHDVADAQQPAKDIRPVHAPAPAPAAVKLYPVVPQENVHTRTEIAQEPAPAWNRFVVHLATNKSSQRLNRFQQKQLAAKAAAMSATGLPVSASTWETPLAHSTSKSLTRDDLLFSKLFNKGNEGLAVSLPTRVLPRGLPCIVPPPSELGPRKQARFDVVAEHGQPVLNASNDAVLSESQLSAAKIQVKLPGRNAAVVQPALTGFSRAPHLQNGPVQGSLGDASTDAIISEVLSSSSPAKGSYDDRHRSREPSAISIGPLDHLHNGFASDSYGYASNGQQQASSAYRKNRRGSNSGMGFYEEGSGSNPAFMVNSEIRNDMGNARGNLSPFGITSSARGSQTQTPASASSVLPSPSLSTQGTWGQSSLTFPVMEPRSSNLADRDHIKSVWSTAADSHARETQNSLKDIADDFLPSTMPMSVHDFRADDPLLTGGEVSSAVNLRQTSPSSHFGRFSQYGRSARESTAQELSPVAHRSSGFEPSARSSSASREANAHLQAAAAASQQRGSNYGSGLNGAALSNTNASQGYGSTFASTYRGQQHADGTGVGHNGLSGYGGYSGSGATGGSLTTDSLYNDVSGYGTGSMTPTNRQSYGQYMSQAPTARSAPGSPYAGDTGRQSSNPSGLGTNYSLFSNGGASNGGSSNRSPHGEGTTGLGVMDESAASAAFGSSGRSQFYSGQASRGYQPGQAYSAAQGQQRQAGQTGSNWPSESTPNPPASTLRPAASVFSPQHYSPSQRPAAKSQAHPSARGSSTGPIDRDPATSTATTNSNAAAFATPSAGYNRFSPSSALW